MTNAEHLLRVMAFSRLCDPESKLETSRWLEGTLVPQVPDDMATHQRLSCTMDIIDGAACFTKGKAAVFDKGNQATDIPIGTTNQ